LGRRRFRIRRHKKKPKAEFLPDPKKTPKFVPFESPNQKTPVWRIRGIDLEENCQWSWYHSSRDSLTELVDHLSSFETMTWQQIEQAGSHNVSIDLLCKAAQDRLVERQQDDIDEIFSLRIGAQKRVWGIRDNEVLRILWWDPEHEVCPSPKKHT